VPGGSRTRRGGTRNDPAFDRNGARRRPDRRHRTSLERGAVSGLAVGVDLVRVDEVQAAILAFGDRYLDRVFTAHERAYAKGEADVQARHLAARFAAKEATIKALAPSEH